MTMFKPLLAETATEAYLNNEATFPYLWSPKLDGIRLPIHMELGPVTRKIKLVPNEKIRQALADPVFRGLDGEIIFGDPLEPKAFNHTQSMVMSQDGPDISEGGRYMVFDDFTNPDEPFSVRFVRAQQRVTDLRKRFPWIEIVPHDFVTNRDQLMTVEALAVRQGYEGIMIRSPAGRYKFGRSTLKEGILLKIKRFKDAEAEIVGVEELYHNDNVMTRDKLGHAERSSHQENLRPGGTLGALILKSPEFSSVFKVGTGFDQDDRDALWGMFKAGILIGRPVTFKYQPAGMKDLPRFPSFKGLRDE